MGAWSEQLLIAQGTTTYEIFKNTIFSFIPETKMSQMPALRVFGTPQLQVKKDLYTSQSPERFGPQIFIVLSELELQNQSLKGLNRTHFMAPKFPEQVLASVSEVRSNKSIEKGAVPDKLIDASSFQFRDIAMTVIQSVDAQEEDAPGPMYARVSASYLWYEGVAPSQPPNTNLVYESQNLMQLPLPAPLRCVWELPTKVQVSGSYISMVPSQTRTQIRLSVGRKLTWVTSSAKVRVCTTFKPSTDQIFTVLSFDPVTIFELSLQKLTVVVNSE